MPAVATGVPVSKPRALKLILEEKGEVKELAFDDQETVTIGRTADNAVRITDALSSRQHCKITATADGFEVEDLKSRNGTRLNGEPLTERTPLAPGDRIEVGDSIIHFEERRQGATSAKVKRRAGGPLRTGDAPRLVAVNGKSKGETVALETLPFVIGRKKGSGFVPADEDVSNEHCMIVEDGGVLHLVDLGSTNGTFVNGHRLRGRAPLSCGTTIRLGATLQLRAESDAGPAQGSARVRKGSARTRKGSARVSKRGKKASARAARPKPVEPESVDEIEDLDALGEEPAAEVRQPERPSRRAAAPAPAPAEDDDVDYEELGESDLIDLDIGARIDAAASEAEEKAGGGGLGAAMLVGMTLLVALTVAYAGRGLLSRPLPDPRVGDNLIENWSFEEALAADGSIPSWEIHADSSVLVGGAEARYGLRSLGMPILPDQGSPEVLSAAVRVTAGKRYRVRASVAVEAGSGAALRVDWSSDVDEAFAQSSVAAVLDPGGDGTWRELGGTVVAPRGATLGRLVAVGLTRGGAGRVRLDRFHLSESDDAERMTLAGPGGLELALDERGVLSLSRSKRELAFKIGLALDRNDPLTMQPAARIEQPLTEQTDGTLLAVSSVPLLSEGKRADVAFTARAVTDGVRLRWSTPEAPGSLHLGFHVGHLADLGAVSLDGQPLPTPLPEAGYHQEGIDEMAWGEGEAQVSFRFDTPATLDVRTLPRGVVFWFALSPRQLATGELGVGMEVAAASLSAHADIQRLLREADEATQSGDYARALRTYATLRSRYSHEAEVVARATREAKALEIRAQRLIDFLDWTAEQARELQIATLADVGRSALAELEAGFGNSDQVRDGQAKLRAVEKAVAERERQEAAQRVRRLLAQALRFRKAGQLRLARLTYEGILANFDPEVTGVAEAKSKLEGLPSEGGK
jgi:pSer/pThr/pTyr-binding forkhead associated (FHA) protein